MKKIFFFLSAVLIQYSQQISAQTDQYPLTPRGYYEAPGVTMMVFDDFYPEGHQGGITLVQCERRLAANGDVRLEDAPGQWSAVPKMGEKQVDREHKRINVQLWYPDSSKHRKGFNPLEYPDLTFRYRVITEPCEEGLRIRVVLEDTLPEKWGEKVGFNLEIFPGEYFGEAFCMDTTSGMFPRQFNGNVERTTDGTLEILPLATGKQLTIAPGNSEKQFTIEARNTTLKLLDGRAFHNNGWFVVRSTFGCTKEIEWVLKPTCNEHWRYGPVLQVSQVGFHPYQQKFAIIELDSRITHFEAPELWRLSHGREVLVKRQEIPSVWGTFLRYKYLRFDFSEIETEGLYKIRYGTKESHVFQISSNIYNTIWQPTVNTFLPVQMCHMRVEDRYKVWHGLCHMDDARMAPTNHSHFDGYHQGPTTLTAFASGEHIPGLRNGGWHDAGDYDLRIESQAETVYKLALGYELFPHQYDETTIDQVSHIVKLHTPDRQPDVLQQIEHGVLSIVGAYESLGRLYRGIICPTLRSYVHLGDAATITDNLPYQNTNHDPVLENPLPPDDRWLFTEENPRHELYTAQALAAAARVLRSYNVQLADRCLLVAEKIFAEHTENISLWKICAAAELFFTTQKDIYKEYVLRHPRILQEHLFECAEIMDRVLPFFSNTAIVDSLRVSARTTREFFDKQKEINPYHVVYSPHIWGAAWSIQHIAVKEFFLARAFPEEFSPHEVFHALNFILGCHPGENTASFVSGVGSHSLTVAYGVNRDEWSYIPGGIASGVALIRPDLPELKTWPYFWQQTEYVLGGGTADFVFLCWAADTLGKKKM